MSQQIRCSVAMANFNHGSYLKKRISSILEQLHDNDEMIIVDDASTDNSVSIIEKFVSENPHVRLLKNAKNLGANAACNRAIEESKGQYLAFMSADDQILPGFFSKTLHALELNPTIGLCCSFPAFCTEIIPGDLDYSSISAHPIIDNVNETTVFTPDHIIDIFKKTGFSIAGHTAIMRTQLFHQYGGFDKRLGPFSDWLLLHAIALKEGVIYIPEMLSVFRIHQNNYCSQTNKIPYIKAVLEKLNGEFKELKPLFRQSNVLKILLRPYLHWVLRKPQYWDFLVPLIIRYFRRRLRRII